MALPGFFFILGVAACYAEDLCQSQLRAVLRIFSRLTPTFLHAADLVQT